MDNKALKTEVYTNENIFSDIVEQPIDVEFTLPDYCPDISKIFKCKTVARISSKSVGDKSITVDGNICITVLYCDPNNHLRSYEYQYPFNKVKEIDLDTKGCNLYASAKTDYINCRAVSGRKIDIHGAVSVNLKLFCRRCSNVISDINDPYIETRRMATPSTSPMGYNEKYTVIEEEIVLSAGSAAIGSIIRYDAYPVITNCKVMNDKVMTKGEMSVMITYCTENSSMVEVVKTLIPFSQVVDVQGITEYCECDTKSLLAFLDVKPKTNMQGECKSFVLNAKLLICAQAYCNDDVPVISDAFSRKYEAEIIKNKITLTKICENIKERFHFKENLSLSEGISSVLDLWCDIQSSNVKFEDDKMLIFGVLMVSIVGVTENGEVAFFEKNVDFEYGYSLNNFNNMLECQPDVCVVSCGYTINTPTLLEIRADIAVNAAVLEKNSMEILTDMKIDEGKIKNKINNCALTVYFVSGQENVWDIARIYNASVDEIIKINNLQDEYITDGSMLLLPIS